MKGNLISVRVEEELRKTQSMSSLNRIFIMFSVPGVSLCRANHAMVFRCLFAPPSHLELHNPDGADILTITTAPRIATH